MDYTEVVALIAGLLVVLALAALLLRGHVRLSGRHGRSKISFSASRRPASRRPASPTGEARIDRSRSRRGGALAEGSSAHISKTSVEGNLVARVEHPGSDGEVSPK